MTGARLPVCALQEFVLAVDCLPVCVREAVLVCAVGWLWLGPRHLLERSEGQGLEDV